MNTSFVENRRTLIASIALAGALAVAVLSLASAAHGGANGAALYPRSTKLTDSKVAHWAVLMRRTVVRAKPGLASKVIATLPKGTTDETQNDVLVLSRIDLSPRSSWYWVRLPILPNNTTGYVQKRDLSPLFTVNTHLYINLGSLTATMALMTPSFFYATLMLGRMLAPFLLRSLSDIKLAQAGLILSCACMAGMIFSQQLPGVVASASAAGLGLSAVYPITISILSKDFAGSSSRIGSFMFVLSNVGGGLFPWIVGVTSDGFGTLKAGLFVPLLGCALMYVLYLQRWDQVSPAGSELSS